MSVKVMAYVWDLNLENPARKLVLLAYANYADNQGRNSFPSIATLARKTGFSSRTVQRITRLLEADGYLIASGGQQGGRGISAHWRIPISHVDTLVSDGNNHDILASFDGDRVTPETQWATSESEKDDTAMSPEPLLTVIEPSDLTGEPIPGIILNELNATPVSRKWWRLIKDARMEKKNRKVEIRIARGKASLEILQSRLAEYLRRQLRGYYAQEIEELSFVYSDKASMSFE
jgi:hypothetical protein